MRATGSGCRSSPAPSLQWRCSHLLQLPLAYTRETAFRSLRHLVMSNDPRVRRLDAAVSEVLIRPIGPTTSDATPGVLEAIEELRRLSRKGSTTEHGLDDIANALLDFYSEALHGESEPY